jgi:uncharacterized protein
MLKRESIMKSRRTVILALAMVFLFSAASYAADLPKVMNIIGHGVGSKLYGLAAGFATVGSKNLPTEIKVVPTSGPAEWVPMSWEGEVDLAVAIAYDGREAYYGEGFFDGKPSSNMRVILSGGKMIIGNLTREKSDIKTGKDLKGKRYVLFSAGSGFTTQGRAFLANAGLTEEDVKVITVPGPKDGVKALIEGRADATGTSEITMGEIAELEASHGARYISLDTSPEALERLLAIYPVGEPILMEPGPGVRGVKEPTWLWAFDWYLLAGTKLSDDAVYQILNTYWEHDAELGPLHPGLKDTKRDRFVSTSLSFPYHEGAVKFYKEKGVWNDKVEKKQAELVAKEKK